MNSTIHFLTLYSITIFLNAQYKIYKKIKKLLILKGFIDKVTQQVLQIINNKKGTIFCDSTFTFII